jgi:hypothetical protein
MNYDESLLQGAYANDNRPATEPEIIYLVIIDKKSVSYSSADRDEVYTQYEEEVNEATENLENKRIEFGWVYDHDYHQKDFAKTYKSFTAEEDHRIRIK